MWLKINSVQVIYPFPNTNHFRFVPLPDRDRETCASKFNEHI